MSTYGPGGWNIPPSPSGSGAQGAQGAQGSQGVVGSQGNAGAQGSAGTGAQGSQGSQGAQGSAGSGGAITFDSGSLGSNVSVTPSALTDILSTNALAAGTWLVVFSFSGLVGTSNLLAAVTAVAGTATVSSFSGKQSSEWLGQASNPMADTLAFVAVLTAGGTLKFQVQINQSTLTIEVNTTSQIQPKATGYVAIKVA